MSKRILYGDYHLLGRLNTGGMAEVFLGRHVDAPPESDLLAVKRMLPRFSRDEEFSTMFEDEARIASRLSHPNICRVLDQGAHQGQLFIVMEFVHGKDMKVVHLRAQERGERIPYTLVAFVLAEIADALAHAHALRNDDGELENLVHRDVSPQNILVSYDGVPKLIDFGVARAKSRAAQTKVGIVKGKFAYMSPEQAMAKELDGRSDIWALGVVLYQLLSGELPFRGSSDIDTLRKIAAGMSVPIEDVAPETPKALAAIIHRALQGDREQRYQTASDFAADLRAFTARSRRTVDAKLLAAYMRRMFERDYMREVNRIRKYQAGADAASLRREKQLRQTSSAEELDAETLSLAAGYQRQRAEEESGLHDVEIEEAADPVAMHAPESEALGGSTGTDAAPRASGAREPYIANPPDDDDGGFEDEQTDESPQFSFDEPTVQNRVPTWPPRRTGAVSSTGFEDSTTRRGIGLRSAVLNRREIVILACLALAGVGVVVGTYFYAQSVPIQRSR